MVFIRRRDTDRTAFACAEEKKPSHAKFENKMFQMVHVTPKRVYLLKLQNFTIHDFMP